MQNSRTLLKELIAKELQHHAFIVFAFLFGSFAEDRATDISDMDVAIYTEKTLSLKETGLITVNLDKAANMKTDLLILNGLYNTRPAFAFEIIAGGDLLYCNDYDMLTTFKTNVFRQYIDTGPLRDMVDKAFRKRLESGNFGERNYA